MCQSVMITAAITCHVMLATVKQTSKHDIMSWKLHSELTSRRHRPMYTVHHENMACCVVYTIHLVNVDQ